VSVGWDLDSAQKKGGADKSLSKHLARGPRRKLSTGKGDVDFSATITSPVLIRVQYYGASNSLFPLFI